jgi:hypothetical protein
MAEDIGGDLDPRVVAAEGDRFRHGRRQRELGEHKALPEADPGKAATTKKPADWPLQLLLEVRKRTDDEVRLDALAILGYQFAAGWGDQKIARAFGQTPAWVRTTLRVARERKLIDDVLSAARARVEHDIVPKAVQALDKLVANASEKAVLGVLQGTGILKPHDTDQAPRQTNLQVNVVVAAGEAPRQLDPTNIVGAPRVLTPPATPIEAP